MSVLHVPEQCAGPRCRVRLLDTDRALVVVPATEARRNPHDDRITVDVDVYCSHRCEQLSRPRPPWYARRASRSNRTQNVTK